MAIQRSLVGRALHVWTADPALDKRHPAFLEKWRAFVKAKDAATLAEVPLVSGEKPTVFEVEGLSRDSFLRIESLVGRGVTNDEAVAFGLRAISPLGAPFTHHGAPVVISPTDLKEVPGTRDKHLVADVLDKLFDPGLFAELAEVIVEISRPDPMRGQG